MLVTRKCKTLARNSLDELARFGNLVSYINTYNETKSRKGYLFIVLNLTAGPSGRSPAEIVGSNPTAHVDVSLL